jgi:mannose-6-phosphate isomerase-like protein (cupin superfamily)
MASSGPEILQGAIALNWKALAGSWALPLTLAGLLACGCQGERRRMQASRRPRNTVLQLAEVLSEVGLQGTRKASCTGWERSESQSLHLLQIRKDALLTERYHEEHDLTLLCVSGNAIVEVEGERHFVEPPTAVFVPRLYAYRILPHRSEKDFVALAVYSPPFGGEDVVLIGE